MCAVAIVVSELGIGS